MATASVLAVKLMTAFIMAVAASFFVRILTLITAIAVIAVLVAAVTHGIPVVWMMMVMTVTLMTGSIMKVALKEIIMSDQKRDHNSPDHHDINVDVSNNGAKSSDGGMRLNGDSRNDGIINGVSGIGSVGNDVNYIIAIIKMPLQ